MSKRFTGNIVTNVPAATSASSVNGVFDVKEELQFRTAGKWQGIPGSGPYLIQNSLRCHIPEKTAFRRQYTTDGDKKLWTWSGWVKGNPAYIFSAGDPITNNAYFHGIRNSGGSLQFQYYPANGAGTAYLNCQAVFRDPNAWYHIIAIWDTNNAVASERMRMYVNGNRMKGDSTSITPSLGQAGYVQSSQNLTGNGIMQLCIANAGMNTYPQANGIDGYIAEWHFLDGIAAGPEEFGYFDSLGIWQPKRYSGQYGDNGFYFPFSDYGLNSAGQATGIQQLARNFAKGSNLQTHSQSFGSWSATNLTVSGGTSDTAAPDGSLTADKIVDNSTNSTHYIAKAAGITMSSNHMYTHSVYLKAGTQRYVSLLCPTGTSSTLWATFDLTAGQIVQNWHGSCTPRMISVGNGWYRCSVTSSCDAAAAANFKIGFNNTGVNPIWPSVPDIPAYVGSGSYFYAWGGQCNLGFTPDEYTYSSSSVVNNNLFTATNFDITNYTYPQFDISTDTPTNWVGTSSLFSNPANSNNTDLGGTVRGNYCIFNYLNTNSNQTLSYGQTTVGASSNGWNTARGSMSVSSGKWYWETYVYNASSTPTIMLGVDDGQYNIQGNPSSIYVGGQTNSWSIYTTDGAKRNNTTSGTSYGSTCASNDVVMCALDMDNGKIWWGKNGTWFASGDPAAGTNAAYTNLSGYSVMPAVSVFDTASVANYNFGSRPFNYTPPVGFKSLNSTNVAAQGTAGLSNAALNPGKYFNVVLHGGAGNVASASVTGAGFKPDLVIRKTRDVAQNWAWYDSTRGGNSELRSNDTTAESVNNQCIRSFDDDGFTYGSSLTSTNAYFFPMWKQAPTAGFNIINYTGNGSSGRAISHNLGVTPDFLIFKNRDGADGWIIFCSGITATTWWDTRLLFTNAAGASGAGYLTQSPTSSNIYVSSGSPVNANGNRYICYAFANSPGMVKVGKYIGNGAADGPFVNCGFKPKMLMVKSVGSTANWFVYDSTRMPYNTALPSTASYLDDWSAEVPAYNNNFEFYSNGFKGISAGGTGVNLNNDTHIYIAFAESPFALNNRAK